MERHVLVQTLASAPPLLRSDVRAFRLSIENNGMLSVLAKVCQRRGIDRIKIMTLQPNAQGELDGFNCVLDTHVEIFQLCHNDLFNWSDSFQLDFVS